MASTSKTAADKTATDTVVKTGTHDRVVGLSINKDGQPDQSKDWEFIGDEDATLEATKEQFRQIAVAAVDAEKRDELGLAGSAAEGSTADAAIDALRAEHEKAASAAEKDAEALVKSHTKGG